MRTICDKHETGVAWLTCNMKYLVLIVTFRYTFTSDDNFTSGIWFVSDIISSFFPVHELNHAPT